MKNYLNFDLEMCVDHPFYYALVVLARYKRIIGDELIEYSVVTKIHGEVVDDYEDIGTFITQTRMTGCYYRKLKSVDIDIVSKTATLEM